MLIPYRVSVGEIRKVARENYSLLCRCVKDSDILLILSVGHFQVA
jgi:hypothetical protein